MLPLANGCLARMRFAARLQRNAMLPMKANKRLITNPAS